ncbi:hypothetical protein VMT65_26320 [Nocardia sp. CDC153]|uniref:hypothetical protein n=1 Tax=Nocardia sp. CDC153 TaxID=3112167 RepID=UPI002DBA6C8A|nr:hypothetical protein [Nocardia sp. CDC153]MEC3956577.1 hypothetical protein [Nocardia sp. CDC153]
MPEHGAMRLSGTVEAMMWIHRNCIEGDGDSEQSCARRQQLLDLRAKYGWTWPLPKPDAAWRLQH